MPGRDGTGPMGNGPRSGRGRGRCGGGRMNEGTAATSSLTEELQRLQERLAKLEAKQEARP
ncbi:MAG TPA: cytoplasmic protein [Elusimicrobia bacterium]|nr:cytoplasmic protein [Elusimicrobiota bacterium]